MLDRPACTLLHLGPGLANSLSNLHNAMRAGSPIVNVIGDHATYHRSYDAPLTSDVEVTARPFSHWVRTCADARSVTVDAAAAVAASMAAPGRIASLILPADAAWGTVPAESAVATPELAPPRTSSADAVEAARRMLATGEPTAIVLGGRATREYPLELAGRIAAATGAQLLYGQTPRIARGAGRVDINILPYPVDGAVAALEGFANIILVGAKPPIAFFAYPDKPSTLYRPGTRIHELARGDEDVTEALEALVDALGASRVTAPTVPRGSSDLPSGGALTPARIGAVLGATLPEQAIVVDEAITTGGTFRGDTRASAPHDWIPTTGGSIGFGLPNAIGAAMACPDRKVVVLEGHGSGMYMPQSLWTMAHENLDITVMVFANNRYRVLEYEMAKVGGDGAGPKASTLLELTDPVIDWVRLATGMGVEAFRAGTVEELIKATTAAYAVKGPVLIEVAM